MSQVTSEQRTGRSSTKADDTRNSRNTSRNREKEEDVPPRTKPEKITTSRSPSSLKTKNETEGSRPSSKHSSGKSTSSITKNMDNMRLDVILMNKLDIPPGVNPSTKIHRGDQSPVGLSTKMIIEDEPNVAIIADKEAKLNLPDVETITKEEEAKLNLQKKDDFMSNIIQPSEEDEPILEGPLNSKHQKHPAGPGEAGSLSNTSEQQNMAAENTQFVPENFNARNPREGGDDNNNNGNNGNRGDGGDNEESNIRENRAIRTRQLTAYEEFVQPYMSLESLSEKSEAYAKNVFKGIPDIPSDLKFKMPLKRLKILEDFKALWEENRQQPFGKKFRNITHSLIQFLIDSNCSHIFQKKVMLEENPDLLSFIESILNRNETFAVSEVANEAFTHLEKDVQQLCNLIRYSACQKQLIDILIFCFEFMCIKETVVSGFSYLAPQEEEKNDEYGFQGNYADNSHIYCKTKITVEGTQQFNDAFLLEPTGEANQHTNNFLKTLGTTVLLPPIYVQGDRGAPTFLSIPYFRAACDTPINGFDTLPFMQTLMEVNACRLWKKSKYRLSDKGNEDAVVIPLTSIRAPITDPNMTILFTKIETNFKYLGWKNDQQQTIRPINIPLPQIGVTYQKFDVGMKSRKLIKLEKLVEVNPKNLKKLYPFKVDFTTLYKKSETAEQFVNDFFADGYHFAVDPIIHMKNYNSNERYEVNTTISFLQGTHANIAGYLLSSILEPATKQSQKQLIEDLKFKFETTKSKKVTEALRVVLTEAQYDDFMKEFEEKDI